MSRTKFLFHAGSAGLAGRINRPFEESLDVQAPTALPPSGGTSKGQAKNIQLREFFQAGSVTSSTTGFFHPATSTYETRSSCVVEKFNLGNGTVTIDLIRAELHSSFFKDSDQAPSIVPTGSAIINMKVNGAPILLENLADRFTELNTMDKLRARHREDEEFRTMAGELMMVDRHQDLIGDKLTKYFPFCHRRPSIELHETKHSAILPLFRILTESGPDFRVVQNVIYIRNFGRIQLGELVVMPFQRQVTGLHADLGSNTGGDITAASVFTNGGQTDPP